MRSTCAAQQRPRGAIGASTSAQLDTVAAALGGGAAIDAFGL
jgi:hypothetical protein